VLVNTNKERKLSDSKYNERRAECEQGLKELQKVINIPNLCGLDSKKFEELKNNISSPIVRKRVKHVVSENERVKSAGEALRKGNLREFGRLMEKSHSSLRDDYEVTGIELDTLFEKARKFDGCIGTRMTGAGFGGCTVNLVHKDKIEDFKSAVADDYTKETGLIPSFYVCEVGDGVKQIS
jgi:galactokinase